MGLSTDTKFCSHQLLNRLHFWGDKFHVSNPQ